MNINSNGEQITQIYVDGLTPYFHRLVSLGHDPLLGMAVGVFDAMRGSMTTIDRTGKIASQFIKTPYSDRVYKDIIEAIKKVIMHLKSDVNTSMGLPVPLMSVFNLFQFGKIGELEQTIAEIMQSMYYDGYDFIHFCSMSIPTIIIELGVRIAYAVKRIKEGYTIKEAIPTTTNRAIKPKLGTMLFTAHGIATAVNSGKVCVEYAKMNGGAATNPFLTVNYPEWLAFMKYSAQQLKWVLHNKPQLRDEYVKRAINDEWNSLGNSIDDLWNNFTKEYTIIV